ncbi:MAG TPA: hypothetical protein VIC84_13040 [Blastocatellia bacterium]
MITEIGTLVAIVKGLADVAKTGTDLFGKRKQDTLDRVDQLKGRVAGIAEQLYETVSLLKTIPAWLRQCEDVLFRPDNLSADAIQQQHILLHRLISDSRYDSFSDAFYRTKYDALPGLEKPMVTFRDLLERFEKDHSQMRFDVELRPLRTDWAKLKGRLRDLRDQAESIRRTANELHGRLIDELKQSGSVHSE